MRTDEPNPASATEQASGSSENVHGEVPDERQRRGSAGDFASKVDLPGKTDSGPEPDVFGQD